jgi:alkanesulfonate monooxygenase SsuD/methylene tetrahydromethanopterin reductase-like flavin-dependent oxidoreductase (luciferase family)
VRQPAVLAKELATLHYLSGGRYIYGIGTGWYKPELEACGIRKEERGRRTDEVLEATLALFRGPVVRYQGRYRQLDEVSVEPFLDPPPPVWVAGGGQLAHEKSPEPPEMHPNVLRRIVAGDGWIARPTAPPPMIAADLAVIEQARRQAGESKPFVVAHENLAWVVERGSREVIVTEQQRRYAGVISGERPWEYRESVYLAGTIDEMQRKLRERIDAGVEYVMLHTLTSDLEQLDLFARHFLEPFAGVEPPVRPGATR